MTKKTKKTSHTSEKHLQLTISELNGKIDQLIRNQRAMERRIDCLKGEILFYLKQDIIGESEVYPNFYIEG